MHHIIRLTGPTPNLRPTYYLQSSTGGREAPTGLRLVYITKIFCFLSVTYHLTYLI